MNHRLLLLLALLGAASFSLTACPGESNDDDSAGDDDDATSDDDDSAGDDDDATGAPFELNGTFDDGFGSGIAVTEHAWLTWSEFGTSRYDITQIDATDGWLIAQNASTNGFNPDLWSRFDWFVDGEDPLFCQTAYDAATEADALATAAADRGDLATGCAGFAWSMLAPDPTRLLVAGVHVDEWGTDHTITDETWTTDGTSSYAISQFDNAARFAIAQNGAANTYNSDLWSRFDFAEYEGSWFMCSTAYDAATEADALATAAADASNPTTGGCSGFAWTNLTP